MTEIIHTLFFFFFLHCETAKYLKLKPIYAQNNFSF